jgi:hypothetical protein
VTPTVWQVPFDKDKVVEELREVLAEAEELVPADMGNYVAAARADTASDLMGTLAALIRDYEKGRLQTLEELIHSDVSGDYLQQADALLRAGYKDPAIVLAGSVLEQHLRQLATKYGITIFAGGVWKKADRLNADLAKAGVYGKTEQKAVTALLGRRNEAAHGEYGLYTAQDARLMLDQIQGMLARFLPNQLRPS